MHESQFCIILSRITSKKSPTQIYFDTYFPCINNCWARPQGLRKLCTSIGGQRAEKFENHWPKSMGVPSSDGAPLFEPKVFRKQMYGIEESTCDIVGTFRCPSSDSGPKALFSSLVTPLKCTSDYSCGAIQLNNGPYRPIKTSGFSKSRFLFRTAKGSVAHRLRALALDGPPVSNHANDVFHPGIYWNKT